jgi:hypothetical protein
VKASWKILICGARDWDDMDKIEDAILNKKRLLGTTFELIIIEGGAPGADTMARIAAHKLNVHVAEVKALWSTRHRGAGPQRNSVMLMLEPDEVIAFHHDIKNSTGTKNMISQAKKAGYETEVIK